MRIKYHLDTIEYLVDEIKIDCTRVGIKNA